MFGSSDVAFHFATHRCLCSKPLLESNSPARNIGAAYQAKSISVGRGESVLIVTEVSFSRSHWRARTPKRCTWWKLLLDEHRLAGRQELQNYKATKETFIITFLRVLLVMGRDLPDVATHIGKEFDRPMRSGALGRCALFFPNSFAVFAVRRPSHARHPKGSKFGSLPQIPEASRDSATNNMRVEKQQLRTITLVSMNRRIRNRS